MFADGRPSVHGVAPSPTALATTELAIERQQQTERAPDERARGEGRFSEVGWLPQHRLLRLSALPNRGERDMGIEGNEIRSARGGLMIIRSG